MITINKVNVLGNKITYYYQRNEEFISLTDMVRNLNNGLVLIEKWLRNKNTIEYLGTWEELNNSNFNSLEFGGIKNEAGTNRFTLSVLQWINRTNSIGIKACAGRYEGTFAHKDIAFEFASWISPRFKLYLIKEFQRLKIDENQRLKLDWDIKRNLAKINYHIHTDAIKNNLIPEKISNTKENIIYATEADILNLALFGITAKDWKERNPKEKGNIRDFQILLNLFAFQILKI